MSTLPRKAWVLGDWLLALDLSQTDVVWVRVRQQQGDVGQAQCPLKWGHNSFL